jgi:hypothetical protein
MYRNAMLLLQLYMHIDNCTRLVNETMKMIPSYYCLAGGHDMSHKDLN